LKRKRGMATWNSQVGVPFERFFKRVSAFSTLQRQRCSMQHVEISADLAPILQLELRKGNRVVRVDVKQWTECDYAVVMAEPLHVGDIEQELRLPATVRFWECRDTHYELQAGYFDDVARHSIAGPLPSQGSLS